MIKHELLPVDAAGRILSLALPIICPRCQGRITAHSVYLASRSLRSFGEWGQRVDRLAARGDVVDLRAGPVLSIIDACANTKCAPL